MNENNCVFLKQSPDSLNLIGQLSNLLILA